MTRILPVGFLLFFFATSLAGRDATEGGKSAGFRGFIGYRPERPTSLDAFPTNIRETVANYLKLRLGETFFSELEFTGGQIVDFEKLCQASPRYKTRRDEVSDYDVHFRFKRPELGIVQYEAQLQLRADGSIKEEADLPSFRTNPEKLKFLSFSQVKAIARDNGLAGSITQANMRYARESDSIFWVLSEVAADDGLVIHYQNIEISAHNGVVIRKYDSTSMR